MTDDNDFNPDWVSRPGDTIADILEERCSPRLEFDQRMGYTPKHAKQLLRSRAPISTATAQKLASVLGTSACKAWIAREAQYRGRALQASQKPERKSERAWLRELPVKDMVEYDWLDRNLFNLDPAAACLRFFGVADIQAWRATYRNVLEMAAFRTSPTFKSTPGALAAWLHQGEVESRLVQCQVLGPKGVSESSIRNTASYSEA